MKKLTKLALSMVAVALVSMTAATAKSKTNVSLIPHGYIGLTNCGTSYAGDTQPEKRPLGQNILAGGGLEANIGLTNMLGIQTGINYMWNNVGSEKVTSNTILGTTVTTDTKSTYTYSSLDFPVLLTLKVSSFSLEAGPYLSLPVGKVTNATSAKITGGSSSSNSSGSSENEFSNKVLFGLMFGGNYETKAGPGKLVAGARYMLDFSPVTVITLKDADGKTTSTADLFTRRALLLNLGYKISL